MRQRKKQKYSSWRVSTGDDLAYVLIFADSPATAEETARAILGVTKRYEGPLKIEPEPPFRVDRVLSRN